MTWLDTWPEVLSALVVLLVPGMLLALVVGLRGWWLWTAAPALSIGAIAALSVLLPLVGVDFSRWSIGIAVVLVAALVYGLRRAAGWTGSNESLALGIPWFTTVGLVAAAVLAAVGAGAGMIDPDAVPQAWDAVFHLNAVRYVLDTGDASPLHLGTMTMPLKDVSIYPSAWHAITALTVTDSPPVAANIIAIMVVAIIFPAANAALAGALAPRSRTLPGLAAVASVAFVAYPSRLLSYGTVWPNALAYSLIPMALAIMVRLVVRDRPRLEDARHVARPVAGPDRAPVGVARNVSLCMALCVVVAGVGATHPNALIGLLVLGAPLLVVSLVHWCVDAVVERRLSSALGALLVAAASVMLVVTLLSTPQARSAARYGGRSTIAQGWEPTVQALTDSQFAGIGFGNATPSWTLAVLTVLGLVAALFGRRTRWLVAGYAASLAFFTASMDPTNPFAFLAGPWYNDPVRLGALVVLAAVPLVALGLEAVVQLVVGLVRLVGRGAVRGRRRDVIVAATAGGLVLVLFVTMTDSARLQQRTERFEGDYARSTDPAWGGLLTRGEQDLMERLDDELPDDALVLGSPFSGAAYLYALTGHQVVFPHFLGGWTPEAKYLGKNLVSIFADPQVCEAIDELGVTHLYLDHQVYWWEHEDQVLYSGIPGDLEGVPGLTVVDRSEFATVYSVDGC